MLLDELTRRGKVRYDTRTEQYVVIHERFPYILVYDKYGTLANAFQLNDFTMGLQRYNPQTLTLQIVLSDHSRLTNISHITSGLYLIKMSTMTNRTVADYTHVWDIDLDYYAINLLNNEIRHIGSARTIERQERMILPLKTMMLINIDGVVSVTKYEDIL